MKNYLQKSIAYPFLMWLLLVLILILLGQNAHSQTPQDFLGLTMKEAKKKLKDMGFKVKFKGYEQHNDSTERLYWQATKKEYDLIELSFHPISWKVIKEFVQFYVIDEDGVIWHSANINKDPEYIE